MRNQFIYFNTFNRVFLTFSLRDTLSTVLSWNRSIFRISSRTMYLNSTRANDEPGTRIVRPRFSWESHRESVATAARITEPSNKSQMAAGDPLAQFHPVSLHPPASLHPAASCVTSPVTLNHPRLCRGHPFCTGNAPTLAEALPPPFRGGKEVGGKTAVPRSSRHSSFSSGAPFSALPPTFALSRFRDIFTPLKLHANA